MSPEAATAAAEVRADMAVLGVDPARAEQAAAGVASAVEARAGLPLAGPLSRTYRLALRGMGLVEQTGPRALLVTLLCLLVVLWRPEAGPAALEVLGLWVTALGLRLGALAALTGAHGVRHIGGRP